MINRDFPNHDVKENVKARWDFPNHELCHVIIRKQLHLNSNNCTSLKTKVTMVNHGRMDKIGQVNCLNIDKEND